MTTYKYGKSFFFATVFVLSSLHIGTWFGNNSNFRITNVVVQGNHFTDKKAILTAAQVPKGENIFDFDILPIQQRLQLLPFVLEARVTRSFPETITILIQERQPIALLNDNGLWPFDKTGYLMPEIETKRHVDLPIVSGLAYSQKATDNKLSDRGMHLDKVITKLYENKISLYHQISEFYLNPEGELTIFLFNAGIPTYLGKHGWEEKCDRLQIFLQQIQPEPNKISTIDLRYRNQIVTQAINASSSQKLNS